jgi:DNA-binding beta-propeller fold protein YncE
MLLASMASGEDMPATAPTTTPEQIALPGSPFGVVASPDGRFAFASLSGATQGIAVVERGSAGTQLLHIIPTAGDAFGLALSGDGGLLLAAVQPEGVAFVDARKAEAGAADAVLGYVSLGGAAGTIEVRFSSDERLVFASEEGGAAVAVIDVVRAFTTGFDVSSVSGTIPVDQFPVGMAVSPDGRYLYVTNEEASPGSPGYDATACTLGTETGPEGTLVVVDVRRALFDPSTSVVSRAYAGCSPVRVALSFGGEVAWVSQRAADTLGAFSTDRLLRDPEHALISATPVGTAPVGVQPFAGGRLIAVANSNRFATSPGTVSIVDATLALFDRPAVVETIDVDVFPREWALSPSGDELYLTEFGSRILDVFDVRGLVRGIRPGAATP